MLIDANEWVGCITVTDEQWVHRLISFNVSGREDRFKMGIRQRDGRCVISGVVNRAAYRGDWTMFYVRSSTYISVRHRELMDSVWIREVDCRYGGYERNVENQFVTEWVDA